MLSRTLRLSEPNLRVTYVHDVALHFNGPPALEFVHSDLHVDEWWVRKLGIELVHRSAEDHCNFVPAMRAPTQYHRIRGCCFGWSCGADPSKLLVRRVVVLVLLFAREIGRLRAQEV